MNALSKFIFISLIILWTFGCKQPEYSNADKPASVNGTRDSIQLYTDYSPFIVRHKQTLHILRAKQDIVAKRSYFFNLMCDSIPLYWHGTKWDFNGTTTIPKTGAIACGYFITTVMQQLGFAVQRERLAQQASSKIIMFFCKSSSHPANFQKLTEWLQKQPNASVFIIGLDFHTGFIIKNLKGSCFFLHSNYIGRTGVMKEPIGSSRALQSSHYFQIGSITENMELMKAW